jgi:hypothetical protein
MRYQIFLGKKEKKSLSEWGLKQENLQMKIMRKYKNFLEKV